MSHGKYPVYPGYFVVEILTVRRKDNYVYVARYGESGEGVTNDSYDLIDFERVLG